MGKRNGNACHLCNYFGLAVVVSKFFGTSLADDDRTNRLSRGRGRLEHVVGDPAKPADKHILCDTVCLFAQYVVKFVLYWGSLEVVQVKQ